MFGPPHNRGFTLLELLVVLALMALATGIAAPRAVAWLDAAQERGWRDDLRAYLEALPVRSFLAGEGRTLEASDVLKVVPGAPPSVEIRLPRALNYSAQGVASGGIVEIRRGQYKETWRIEPLTGHVKEGF
jgi:general secretion pathway protein G